MRDQEHNRSNPLHHHDKHAAHKAGHRPDDPHGVTGEVPDPIMDTSDDPNPVFHNRPLEGLFGEILNRDTRRGKRSDPITDHSDDPNPSVSYLDIHKHLDFHEEAYMNTELSESSDEYWVLRQNWLDAQDIERNRSRQILGTPNPENGE